MRKQPWLLIGVILLVASCSKNDMKSLNSDNTPNKSERDLSNTPTVFNMSHPSTTPITELNKRKNNSMSFLRDSVWSNGKGHSFVYESTDIPIIDPTSAMTYYLGGITNSTKALAIGQPYIPPAIDFNNINPVTIYANFPTDSIYTTGFPSPILQNTYVRNALKAGSGEQLESFTYEMDQIRHVEEVEKSFGANFNIGNIFKVGVFDTSSIGDFKTTVSAQYTQANFTVTLQPPIYGPFLKPGTDLSSVGSDPLITSYITYGTKGVFLMQSDSSYEFVQNILNISFNLSANLLLGRTDTSKTNFLDNLSIGLNANLTKTQLDVIQKSKTYFYCVGEDATLAHLAVVNGFQGFCQALASGAGFSASHPGVPLYYRLNHLNSFTPFTHEVIINYPNN